MVIATKGEISHGKFAAAQPGARKSVPPRSAKSAAVRYVSLRAVEESTRQLLSSGRRVPHPRSPLWARSYKMLRSVVRRDPLEKTARRRCMEELVKNRDALLESSVMVLQALDTLADEENGIYRSRGE